MSHNNTKNHRLSMKVFAVIATAVCASAFAVFVHAQGLGHIGIEKTLHVFPSSIISGEWQNTESLYLQDLGEDALYQDFNTNNSAYVTVQAASPSSETDAASVSPEVQGTSDVFSEEPVLDAPPESAPGDDASVEDVVPGTDDAAMSGTFEVARTKLSLLFSRVIDRTLLVFGEASSTDGVESSLVEEILPAQESTPNTQPTDATSSTTPSTDVADDVAVPDEIGTAPTSSPEALPEPVDVATTTDSVDETDVHASTTPELGSLPSARKVLCQGLPECKSYSIEFEGFSIPGLDSGESIDGAQIRFSFAAQEGALPAELVGMHGAYVEYSFGEDWEGAGVVSVSGEVSNALNGGYFLVALPDIESPDVLKKLRVRFTYLGDARALSGIYLDGLWLELRMRTVDEEMLRARTLPDVLALKKPAIHELLSRKLDFTMGELPAFELRYAEQRNFFVKLFRKLFADNVGLVQSVSFLHRDIGDVGIVPLVNITPDGLWSIRIPESEKAKLKPGVYTLAIAIDEGGKIYEDQFEFQWGLLAFNTNQSEYEVGAVADISLAALSPNGNTVCDANLTLYVIEPNAFVRELPVTPSGLCSGNNIIDVPDYRAAYVTEVAGTHRLYLERLDEYGAVIAHTEDTFEVVHASDITIVRTGPTRIYPVEPYEMSIDVRADTTFEGTFTETVPPDFEIFDTDARVYVQDDRKVLEWDIRVLQGTSQTLSYRFDAPDLSPYLYTLGPATLMATGGNSTSTTTASSTPSSGDLTFTEHRAWQVASDATGNMIIFYDGSGAIPTGWTCLSCGSGTFYQRFVRGDSTYNSTGGATTHTPTVSSSLQTSSNGTIENFNTGTIAVTAHTHTYTPTIGSGSNLPSYGQLRVLQYTDAAGEPPSLPAGAMVLFDSTMPSGWTASTTMQGRYPRGENAPGVTGGSNTHTHTITGTTGAAGGSTVGARGGGTQVAGANASHTHTVSSSTPSTSNEPAYIEAMLGRTASATTTPVGMIAMWTDTPPAGWANLSAGSGDAFYQKVLKIGASYGATGGSDTHTHSNVTGIATAVTGATTLAREDLVTPAGAAGAHTHTVDITSFSSTSNLPPYVTAIFAKRQGTDPVYQQLAFRLYANTNAQTPTDPWPSGATNLGESEPLTATSTPVANGAEIRVRMNVAVSNATTTASGESFKLQYGAGAVCSAISSWTDVGASTSSVIWRGYNNTTPTDGSTLSSTTLSATDVAQTYEENNPSALVPNQIDIGEVAEWDWVLEHNDALPGTQYCFRMIEADGDVFNTYTRYPAVYTNESPSAPEQSAPFDNEKTASTTPFFEFVASDPEGQDVHYQIQVDDDPAFGSVAIDNTTISNSTRFQNLVTAANKEPYYESELIRFTPGSGLLDGTTYWWRVRALDPDGSNEWGDWSSSWSVTIDTLLPASAWYQTTNEQFDTNTLVGVESGSGSVSLISGSTTGTITTGEVDFDWGIRGTAWGELAWSDTETTGDIKYQVQYYTTGGSWALIPNADLSGNSTGFDTSPVSLLDLDTDTYNRLRLVANFTNSGGSPSLQDWTLAWGYRVETPTITKPFANEKVGTTTPVFEFSTTDPQGDSLTYQIQWSTDYTFAASTTRTSDTDGGFENVTTPIEPDPYTSGDTIRFTIEPGDALVDNTTYWWRVRAKDPPPGSDNYSLWTDPRSFTVATTTVASTWYQTTDEQFDTNILSGTESSGLDSLRVATTADEVLLVYGEGTENTPRYREWDGSAWAPEGSLLSVGAPVAWAVVEAGTTREEYVAATLGTDNDVNMQVYSEGAWGDLYELTTTANNTKARGFDIAYETTSGDLIAVACDGDADPTYIIWDGSSWGSGGTVNLASTNNCEWIQLASDPASASNEIILLSRDSTGTQYEAQVWNGSSWGNSTVIGSINDPANEGMAVEYEASGGQALIAVSDGSPPRFAWNSWDGATWGAASTHAIGNDFEWGYLTRDEGSDNMALCLVDDNDDVSVVRWNGSSWAANAILDAAGNSDTDRPTSCAFETNGSRDGYIMTAYSDTTNARYSSWNGSAWGTEASISTIEDSATMQLRRAGDGTILGLFFDDTNDRYDFSSWNGSSWSTVETLESNASVSTVPYGEPYMLSARNPGREGTVVVAPGIDFTEGSGPYWEEMSWNDTTPGSSSILYQVQYQTATGTWLAIPNSAIPGNSVGTSTSPIDLSGLNVSTYNMLRPRAVLTCDISYNCPEISDWTIEWAEGITISGTLHQYNQTSSTTSGTVEVAVNGVLQTGKTGTVSNGTWSIGNVTTVAGDVVTVYVGGALDTAEAVGVTTYDGTGDITGFTLYERHLAIGSDDLATVRNADIGLYDFTDDEDLFADVDGGNDLTVCATSACHDAEIIVKAGNTYQPGAGGNVTTHDIEINGTFVANGNTIRVTGSWDNNATATMGTSTVIFTATSTTESVNETGASSPSFYNLTFGETSGTATWTLATPLDVNGALAVSHGTLARGTQAINVAGALTNGANGLWTGVGTTTFDGSGSSLWTDSAATKQNIGRALIDGTSKTITLGSNVRAQSVTIGANDIFDASTSHYDIEVLGNWINNNTFVPRNGTVTFAATTTGNIITHGASNFYDLTFSGGGGAWSFTQSAVTVGNDLVISAGTVTLPTTGTTTVTGSFNSTGGAFAHNNGTLYFNSSAAETITLAGGAFTNTLHNLTFGGTGSWSMTDTNATSSNDVRITAGSVTLPGGTFAIGGVFSNTAGTFAHNSGTLQFTSAGAETIRTNGSSFNTLLFTGGGSWSFLSTNATLADDLRVLSGTVALPSGTLTIGGSYINNATVTHSSGTVLFNSADTGESVTFGTSNLYNATFNAAGGGWTVTGSGTTTNNFTLTSASDFTLASGATLAVGGTFTNSVGGAATTWTGSTLSLYSGTTYALNTKSNTGDAYNVLAIAANTDIRMWNSSAGTYTVHASGSLYSQDHAAVDGDLYIFGSYGRTSGTEHWSYATDFDGTSLGGGSRQVDVRFATGSTAVLSNSTLSIVGDASASTTIAAQSGTYTVSVTGGTTTASHYRFSDLGSSGVSLLGATAVTSLADGYFSPAVAGGAGMTVSSTTIDANPAEQFYRVEFATTTAIAAYSVAQTDGTPTSFWWFRESAGNLSGEVYDNDTGDPGSVRWDNSSLSVTLSGTVYSDIGLTQMGAPTCDDVTNVVAVAVDGVVVDSEPCSSADGSYSISNVAVIADPSVTVFLNTGGGERAAVVTKTITGDISDLDLYANRVIVRHEDVSVLSIADMVHYDEDNDSDLPFVAATGSPNTLTVRPDTELLVHTGDTFAPGGNVTLEPGGTGNTYDGTLHVDNNATFTAVGTESHSVGGRLLVDSGALFTAASSTVSMTATTTDKVITSPNVAGITFHNLSFTGVGGGWPINTDITVLGDMSVATGTVSGDSDITLRNGELTGAGLLAMSAGTVTIEETNTLGGVQGWTFYNLTLGDGTTVGSTARTDTATTTVLSVLTIRTGHTLDLNSAGLDLRGNGTPLAINGVFDADTSTVRYSTSTTANVVSTTYYNLDLNAVSGTATYTATGMGIIVEGNLTIGGQAATTFNVNTNDPALSVDGDVYIRPNGTLIASASGALTLSGSYENDGTFTSSGGSLTFDGSGVHTIEAGASSFGVVVVNGTGSFTISEHATSTGAFTLTNAGGFTVSSGVSLAVGGTFTNSEGGAATTWTGSTLSLYSGTSYSMNVKTVSDQYDILSVGANTDVRMWNSSAGTYNVNASGSLYSQDHAAVDGDLYIYGDYVKTSGTDYWSYATDFDGTSLTGSERKVDVFFASGAAATYTGGGLTILGGATASTTLQNQGSGTYNLTIGGTATINAQYYEMRHMAASGLTLTGTPTVTTLSRGDFEVSQNAGSAITVGGTVITQNPAKNFTLNRFATSTGVASAVNVTATGTTVSSWRFTNHYGNIDGEPYDSDPDGNPGYIVWDDSAGQITISGNVYQDEGTTVSSVCDGTTDNIRLVVDGITGTSTSCNAGTGAFSIPGVSYGPTDTLTLFIDGEAVQAANVTVDPVSSIANMHLYENRVIVRHENTDPMSILDMSVYDFSDDPDIPFTATDGSPDTLTLPADMKLIVWTGKTFTPGGNVTLAGGGAGAAYDGTLELYTNAAFVAAGTESHSVGGSFISGTGASLTPAQSTFTFTTDDAARTVDINEGTFYNLVFNGVGSWTISGNNITTSNNFTISQGTVTLPSATTTIGSSFENTGGSFTHDGVMYFTATSGGKTVRPGSSPFDALVFNGAGGAWSFAGTNATTSSFTLNTGTVTLPSGTFASGGVFNNVGGTLTHNSGTVRLTATTTDTVLRTNGSNLHSVTVAGSGSYEMVDTNLTLAGTLGITQGSVAFATGTLSIGGSLLNTGGAFDHASGTVLFNSSDAGESVDVGGSDFNHVSFASPTGGWTITDSATSTGNFTLSSATNFTLASGATLTVEGVFTNLVGGSATTWNGSTLAINSGTGYTANTKVAGGDRYNTLIVRAGTDLRLWNSSATTTTVAATSSLYSQDHAAVNGSLYVYGDYLRTTGTDYWSYATDFDGTDLTGGSERQVTVAHAANATTTFTGATLHMRGTAAATTTVTNQGSGTYTLIVDDGTLNARYYAVRNANADGLTLSGLNTITSIQNGDFELAVNGGSLITVSSTTVNANASLSIPGMRFATTSAITGTNVEIVGTTPNAWTFTGHIGNLDGEAYDNDGGDDCGSIRWDDSSCLLTQQSDYRWRDDNGGEGVPDSEWFDQDWTKRMRVTVDNADAIEYTDAVIKVPVTYDAEMQSDFDDLRFTDDDGTTAIPYWIETYTASTDAVVWVKVPTLAASERTSVYMYYGNGAATDASSGTTTFTVFDDFEDNDIAEYSGNTTLFQTDSGTVYERSYRLEAQDVNGKTTVGIYDTSVSVGQGETIRFLQYIDTAFVQDETCTLFGVETPGTDSDNYGVCLSLFGTDRLSISKDVENTDDDDGATVLATQAMTFATGWHEVEVRWGTDDSISATVSKDGSVVATTSVTDSTYTAAGGIGFTFWVNHGAWDAFTTRPLLATEPTVGFGAEQSPGGASWTAALNTPLTSGTQNETQRIRFLIENSGLSITDQNFDLEFAAKGAAPSCEAVDYGDYAPVPPQSSCAGSAICMQTSTEFTNQASTTDLLGGDGTFTAGQIVESPSDTTGDIDVDTDEFTELEYAIVATDDADDTAYCLRVTNAGSELDSYARMAEFGLRFDPTVLSWSLNSGLDIVLSPGTTTRVYATGTVSDSNGYADLLFATTTMYRSFLGAACTADNNNCYRVASTSCSFSGCSGNSCAVSCYADFQFFADPTDFGTYAAQDWRADLLVSDLAGGTDTQSTIGTELATVRALSVTSSISYGSLEVAGNTGSYNPTTTVENIGNDAIDVSLSGDDLSDGLSSTIPVANQKYATTTFTYSSCTYCATLSGVATGYEVDLTKPTTTTPVISDAIYWGIQVPFGAAANPHQGSNTFYATGD